MRKVSPEKARELVRKVLQQNNGNVSKTARILGISRNTVRRARNGPLKDLSRRPKNSPNKTDSKLEQLILQEARKTGFRYRRLAMYLGLYIPENTIKAILKRNQIPKKKRKSASGKYRQLYDYENLIPFTHFQLDTKHLLDFSSLPKEVYNHMIKANLPKYELSFIDVASRARFSWYCYELNSHYSLMFVIFCVLWLRLHNVRGKIKIRLDNGGEFCGRSYKKRQKWQNILSKLGVELEIIPPGAKHLMAIVENAHRKDDEEFLIVHAEKCRCKEEFIQKAQRWQDSWNYARNNFGKGMNGKTPYEKLKSNKGNMVSERILGFPVLLVEDVQKVVGNFALLFDDNYFSGGKYLPTTCQTRTRQNRTEIAFSMQKRWVPISCDRSCWQPKHTSHSEG
jgi:transposase-like protein